MSGRLAGSVAVVTGAASGIGRAYAARLASDGANVAVLDRADAADTIALCEAAGGSATAHRVDVTEPDEVAAAAADVRAAHGPVDILVNNAGIYPNQMFESMSFDDWRRVFTVNVDSLFVVTQAFLPHLKERGGGRIVNMTSNTVGLVIPGFVHYIASKMAVIGMTRALATELAPDGITVNAIGPSLVRTPGTEAGPAEFFDIVPQLQAIKRGEQPEDLTGTLAYLVSDDAAFVTGQTFWVDGGLLRSG